MTSEKKLDVIKEAFNYYHDRNSLTSEDEKKLLNLVNELYEYVSCASHSFKERGVLKTTRERNAFNDGYSLGRKSAQNKLYS